MGAQAVPGAGLPGVLGVPESSCGERAVDGPAPSGLRAGGWEEVLCPHARASCWLNTVRTERAGEPGDGAQRRMFRAAWCSVSRNQGEEGQREGRSPKAEFPGGNAYLSSRSLSAW